MTAAQSAEDRVDARRHDHDSAGSRQKSQPSTALQHERAGDRARREILVKT